MVDYHQAEPFFMSSICPYSCALVRFALRLGGTIDPEFLLQCQIQDKKFQTAVAALKPVPLIFEGPSAYVDYQQDIFLDMNISNGNQFYDPVEFKEYNSWLGSSDQLNATYGTHNDIFIDLI